MRKNLDELGTHLLGVSSSTITGLLDLHFEELGAERLNLLSHSRTGIEASHNRALEKK